MHSTIHWLNYTSCALLFVGGCGHAQHEQEAATAECSPGATYSCSPRSPCPAGQSGGQLCRDDGTLTSCECPSAVVSLDAGKTQPGSSGDDAGRAHDAATTAPKDAGGDMDSGNGDAGNKNDAGHKTDAGKSDPNAQSENCGNGVDDDGDGKIDCADDDCAARTCLGAAPDGWSGPSVLYVGDDKQQRCSGSYATMLESGGSGVSASPAECSSCSCDKTGSGCGSYLYFGFSTHDSCSDAACAPVAVSMSCVELSNSCLSASSLYLSTELPPDAAHCTPSTQTPTLEDPSFAASVLACGADSLRRGGCDPGELCAPAKPFDGPFCIVKTGDVPCPSGPYSDRRVYFAAIDDMRDCSACSCDGDCSYSWKLFDDNGCGHAVETRDAEGECVAATPNAGKVSVGAEISGSATCTASGGEPTGEAKASDPFTACCLP